MRENSHFALSLLLVCGVLIFWVGPALAVDGVPVRDGAEAQLIPRTEPLPTELGYSDVDKSHGGTGGWGQNHYDDLNNNGSHDPGEPFADTVNPLWGNPRLGTDNSCWLASACNMLEQLGKVPDADVLYANYALNGVPSPGGVLTWDEGGLQEYAIQHWMNLNPAGAAGMVMNIHWPNPTWAWNDQMFAWDWVDGATSPRAGVDNYLQAGWEVGIGMWPLLTDGLGNYWHDFGHALTMQDLYANMTFDCTDSDRDWSWMNPLTHDVNTYNDAVRGPQSPDGGITWLWGWYNDFYDGNIAVYPVGDFGYVCAIIPEPATMGLLAVGGLLALTRRKRK